MPEETPTSEKSLEELEKINKKRKLVDVKR